MTSYDGHPGSISHTFAHVITYACPLYKKGREKHLSLMVFPRLLGNKNGPPKNSAQLCDLNTKQESRNPTRRHDQHISV